MVSGLGSTGSGLSVYLEVHRYSRPTCNCTESSNKMLVWLEPTNSTFACNYPWAFKKKIELGFRFGGSWQVLLSVWLF